LKSGDPKRVAEALAGPDAMAARDAVRALLSKPLDATVKAALVDGLLGAPGLWSQVDAQLVERKGTAAQRAQAFETQLSVAQQKDAPTWAVYGVATAAATGAPAALELVRRLATEGRADVKEAARQSADGVARERPLEALRLLDAVGSPLTAPVADGLAAMRTALPSEAGPTLARLTARGDARAAEVLTGVSERWWAQGALREAFRAGDEGVKAQLAPFVRGWESADGIETLVAGARAGAAGATESLGRALDFMAPGEAQREPIAALREGLSRNDPAAWARRREKNKNFKPGNQEPVPEAEDGAMVREARPRQRSGVRNPAGRG
jgi:hypothetical protein